MPMFSCVDCIDMVHATSSSDMRTSKGSVQQLYMSPLQSRRVQAPRPQFRNCLIVLCSLPASDCLAHATHSSAVSLKISMRTLTHGTHPLPRLSVVMFLVASSIHQIDQGHVGVYFRGGALLDGVSEPGFHLMLPLVDNVRSIQITMQKDEVLNVPCGTSGEWCKHAAGYIITLS